MFTPFSPTVADASETSGFVDFVATARDWIAQGALAGAVVLVADRERLRLNEAIGYADLQNREPIRHDSFFWIASMTKPVTAAAIMMLVEEGKLSLDDVVEKHLPEFKSIQISTPEGGVKPPSRAITLRDLLCHTGGLAFLSPRELETSIDRHSFQDKVQDYLSAPLPKDPGEQYLYSNQGYNCAARVLEVVSGMSYEQFLDERIFKPLGMTQTTFWPDDAQVARLVKAYGPDAAQTALIEIPIGFLHYPLQDRITRFPEAGGGLFSTGDDVLRFGRMILNRGVYEGKRYLSESSIDEMSRDQTGTLNANYGLGFSLYQNCFGHGGAYSTNLTIYPRHGLVSIFLSQQRGVLPNRNIGENLLPTLLAAVKSLPEQPPAR